MPYEALASSSSPGLIIYVLDISASMLRPYGERSRIAVILDAFRITLRQMVLRSTKGTRVAPRYRLAIFAYNDHVYDLLDGIKTVDQVVRYGVPELTPAGGTDTAKAFRQVERLLKRELEHLDSCPAPLICHMTDGSFVGDDPEPIVRRIRAMETPDGNPLVENVFIAPNILAAPVDDVSQWPGITSETKLRTEYAYALRAMSSPLPPTYRLMLSEAGYNLAPGAVMMLPGASLQLIELGMVMSAATPIAR